MGSGGNGICPFAARAQDHQSVYPTFGTPFFRDTCSGDTCRDTESRDAEPRDTDFRDTDFRDADFRDADFRSLTLGTATTEAVDAALPALGRSPWVPGTIRRPAAVHEVGLHTLPPAGGRTPCTSTSLANVNRSVDTLPETMERERDRSRSPPGGRGEMYGPVLRCLAFVLPQHHPDCNYLGTWLHHSVTQLRLRQNCPRCGREMPEADPPATKQPSVQGLNAKD